MEIVWSISEWGSLYSDAHKTQITALMKHISCQNYVNNIIPSLFRSVVPLAQDFWLPQWQQKVQYRAITQPQPLSAVHCRWSCWISPPAVSTSVSSFRYDGIWWFCNLGHTLLRLLCTDARVSTCPVSPDEAAAPASSHFWCPSLTSHVLLERQRPEPHSLLETVRVRLLYRAKSAAKMSLLFCPWYLFWWWAAFCWLCGCC